MNKNFKIHGDAAFNQCKSIFELINTLHTSKSEFFAAYDEKKYERQGNTPRVTAFYLPQFHAIPENDRAWGKGFTEWTNVTRTLPYFPGHIQPYLPSDLGFYDLNNSEILRSQIDLATHYGLTGFCFHYYWFQGKKVLQKPLENFLKINPSNFEFSVCWANEPWSRRWDGSDHDVIIPQNHSFEDDKNLIFDLIPLMERSNYIRVNGRPLLILYRPSLLGGDLKRTIEFWRATAIKNNLGNPLILSGPYGLSSAQMSINNGVLDGYVQFPPHEFSRYGIKANIQSMPFLINKQFKGGLHDSVMAKNYFTTADYGGNLVFKCAFPSWDNTARKRENSAIFCNSTPNNFEEWMKSNLKSVIAEPRYDGLTFVNAWNEWAEGAVLEPSRWYGYAYLTALKNALTFISYTDK